MLLLVGGDSGGGGGFWCCWVVSGDVCVGEIVVLLLVGGDSGWMVAVGTGVVGWLVVMCVCVEGGSGLVVRGWR